MATIIQSLSHFFPKLLSAKILENLGFLGGQKRVQSKIAAGCLKQAILAADKVNAAIVTYFESDT